jgi:hypothetical protein
MTILNTWQHHALAESISSHDQTVRFDIISRGGNHGLKVINVCIREIEQDVVTAILCYELTLHHSAPILLDRFDHTERVPTRPHWKKHGMSMFTAEYDDHDVFRLTG